MQSQNESALAIHDNSKDTPAVANEVAPQSDGQHATKADSRSQPDEQNSGIAPPVAAVGMVAVAEPLVKSPTSVAKAADVANPSESTSETPARVSAGVRASARPQVSTDKVARETATATVAEVTASKHASVTPQLEATDASPAVSAAAAVAGAHVAAQSQSDIVNSLPVSSVSRVGEVSPGALVAALPQAVAANLPATTRAAHSSATPHPDAGNSAAVASVGAVAPANANTTARLALDPTNPQPASTLPAGNGMATITTPQSQLHDARSDPAPAPIYSAGVVSPTAPSDAPNIPPSGVSAAPPTGTAAQQVAMHVAQSLNDGGKTVTIELHPAELGRVEIHFSFHSDGTDVRLTVDRPETFDAFSHDRSGLQQQLTQAGVNLGSGGLDLRLGQQQPDQSGSYSSGRTPRVTVPTPQPAAPPVTLWVSNGLLDILA